VENPIQWSQASLFRIHNWWTYDLGAESQLTEGQAHCDPAQHSKSGNDSDNNLLPRPMRKRISTVTKYCPEVQFSVIEKNVFPHEVDPVFGPHLRRKLEKRKQDMFES
jgi:hypothetical protein